MCAAHLFLSALLQLFKSLLILFPHAGVELKIVPGT
jgi:hypothetical protein